MTDKKLNKKRYNFAIETSFHDCNPTAVVFASGEDAETFIQGQVTQDLNGLKKNDVCYGFLLSQKGRVIGDVHISSRFPNRLALLSWSLTGEELIARLETYLIADDVELTDETSAWRGWQVAGPEAEAWLAGQSPADQQRLAWREPLRLPPYSIRLIGMSEPDWPGHWCHAPDMAFEAVRIAAGIPKVPVDLGPGDFPQEAGQEKSGVSFTKGCYLGQEVMARLAATGRLRRQLHKVAGSGRVPTDSEMPLTQNEKVVGTLRSRAQVDEAGWVGLAMINLAHFSEEIPVVLSSAERIEVGDPVG